MKANPNEISAKWIVMLFLAIITALTLKKGLVSDAIWYNVSFFTIPLMLLLMLPLKRKE